MTSTKTYFVFTVVCMLVVVDILIYDKLQHIEYLLMSGVK